MQCPSDDIISDYLQGQLSIAHRSQADEHLDQCQECRSLISELARSTAISDASESNVGESLPGIGPGVLIAGKYEVIEEIATGGMGVVYLAQQAGLNRTVAIKLMRSSVAGCVDAAIRFTREARIAAQLASPHIVSVLDIGLTDDGLPFIVMEHLKGHDLEEHLTKNGPLAFDEAIGLFRQICRGLYEAHNHGIVHRDLKPGNIFLVSESGGYRAVLLDFGVSKQASQSEVGLTQTGMVMGSPRYMSPEQLADSKSVDHRSDIWSLGVILYEIIAGTPPYKSTTLVHLVTEILQGTPQPLRELRPDVPASLAAIVKRCMRREPEHRFESADALSQALSGSQGSSLVPTNLSLPIPVVPTPAPASKRLRVALIGGTLTGLAVLSLILLSRDGPGGGEVRDEPTSVPAKGATVKAQSGLEAKPVEPEVTEIKPVEPKVSESKPVEPKVSETKASSKQPRKNTGHAPVKQSKPTPKVNKEPVTRPQVEENDDDAILNIPL